MLYVDLNEKYIIERFPELKEEVVKEVEFLEEFLPSVIFENIFHSFTNSLLKKEDYSTNHVLKRIFDMYEELSKEGDEDIQNLVEVSLLECLWDERVTYDRALELMGQETKTIWDRIEWLNIPVN